MDKPKVCSAEDAVLAFLEYLVDPVLPCKSSMRQTPTESMQQSVAKQVHAVVLLYNYYHRKQNRLADHLDFVQFCKLAVVLRSSLMAHMRFMQSSDDIELSDIKNQLSVVEKKIMDACGISMSLDAANDTPVTNGWPTSKVAVFLIDSRKEKCFLQFSVVTKGVWSVIEKDVDALCHYADSLLEPKCLSKRKRNLNTSSGPFLASDEVGFRQIAFSAVEAASGIGQSDLTIVESGDTYCLSLEKKAVHFYIMQCTEPKRDAVIQTPIRDVIDSLLGPLVQESLGQWIVTAAVEYFHVLPYSRILSDWLSRGKVSNKLHDQKRWLGVLDVHNTEAIGKPCESEIDNNKFQTEDVLSFESGIKSTRKIDDERQCINSHPNATDGLHNMELDEVSLIFPQQMDARKTFIGKSVPHDKQNIIDSCTNSDINRSTHDVKVETRSAVEIGTSTETKKLSNQIGQCTDGSSDVIGRHQNMDLDNCSVILCEDKDTVQPDSQQKVTNCTKSALKGITDCAKACMFKPMTRGIADHGVENLAKRKMACQDMISGHDATVNGCHARLTCQSQVRDFNKIQHTIASKEKALSETALRVLFSKRDKLVLQQRNIEDEIALCDKKIQMILHGGDDHLALKIDAIIEGCNDTCQRICTQENPGMDSGDQCSCQSCQCTEGERSSEAVSNVQTHCQELDVLCCKQKWVLPSYRVYPIDGGFKASLTVKGMDFESSTAGEVRPSPGEARESAAAQMLGELQGHLKRCV